MHTKRLSYRQLVKSCIAAINEVIQLALNVVQ
jgi:hypothetical protein